MNWEFLNEYGGHARHNIKILLRWAVRQTLELANDSIFFS